MKHCRSCNTDKPLCLFNKHKSRKDGLQVRCRVCQNTKDKALYDSSVVRRNRVRDRNSARVAANRQYVADYLATHLCVDCGEDDLVVLDFDHVRGKKLGNVSEMWRAQCSWQKLLDEIAKCVVRCANCHRRVTHQRRAGVANVGIATGFYPV